MVRTDGLGNDPRWGEALRQLAAEVIAAAPPSATVARCTISGADYDFECGLEFGPDLGVTNPNEKLQVAAAELVGVWFDHNSEFQGLDLSMAKEPDGNWQIQIDVLTDPPPRSAPVPASAGGWNPNAGHQAPSAGDRGFVESNQTHEPEEPSDNSKQSKPGSGKRTQRGVTRPGAALEDRQGLPPWVKMALVSVAALLVLGGVGGGIFYFISQIKPPPKAVPIAEARKAFETELIKKTEAPQKYDKNPPDGVKVVEYESGDRKLMAWLVLPDREPPFPAVVFAHDGFALTRGDYENSKAFVDQGFAVLLPSYRAENGNPGDFEMCYGEVDDLVNAIDYLASRKKVDPKNIYAVGYGVGATNVMLAAELSKNLRKVAVCGGRPDMCEAGTAYENAPFDRKVEQELLMRSPGRFPNDLTCPMLLLYAGNDPADKLFQEQAKKMEKECKTEPILVEEIPGVTHETAIAPALTKMITFLHAR